MWGGQSWLQPPFRRLRREANTVLGELSYQLSTEKNP
jgi:hypothetical protein